MSPNAFMHPASYRDPSGFMFEKDGVLYRQVNKVFKEHYDHFIQSGCYKFLTEESRLISHQTIDENLSGDPEGYLTLKPEKIDFISYPYEWSFDMLKDAALLTLQLVKDAVSFGLILKDATPYNIQWHKGKFIFIDTLSFEKYNETEPWIAYRQFCESFLGPLLLMHYHKTSFQQLSLSYPEGIPLTIIKKLLPSKSRFSLHTYLHIHVHATISGGNKANNNRKVIFSKKKMLNLVNSLETLVNGLRFSQQESTWSAYYEEAGKRDDYIDQKKKIIAAWIEAIPGITRAADLGANEGEFSKLLSEKNIPVVAADFDSLCINNFYNQIKSASIKNIQPLIIDLSNPSPAIGVNNEEHSSFLSRCQADLVLALALIHHLAIGKNIPFEKIAAFFSRVTEHLIIEYVPKEDEKVKMLLKNKKDIYTEYNEKNFVSIFEKYFSILERKIVGKTERVLFKMKVINLPPQ